jgi:ABC-type Fe3+ transport system substrate-binding protein
VIRKLHSLAQQIIRQALALLALLLSSIFVSPAARAQAPWQTEWTQRLEAAKKDGKVVLSIPPSTELRNALETSVKKRFGFEIEVVPGAAAKIIRRISDEYQAGVRYFDVIISTFDNLEHSLIPMGAVDPLESHWILPEVRDAKNWWGGHIWTDNTKRFAYSPFAYMQDNLWHNTDLVKAEEIRIYDDLLRPKWKGKIGLWDPRQGGASGGKWAFLWATKGEAYLKRLMEQVSLVAVDRRQVADALAKGTIAVSIGPTYYSFVSYVKAGLPVKPLPPIKEGTYVSMGNGGPVAIRNAPHPNATKILVNWLLSKEGQEIYSKAQGQATRRLDVDTQSMEEFGIRAAKDTITIEEFQKYENQSENRVKAVRRPAQEFAKKLLP